jgi:peptide/nickel transport system permease protein
MRALLRRLALYLAAAWVALTVNFFLPRLMPGDPVARMFASYQGQLEPETLAALRRTYGLTDAPLWQQYTRYLGQVAHGELGVSLTYFPAPVTQVIATGMFWTLLLAGTSVLFSFVLGTLLGIVVAWRDDGRLDSLVVPALSFLGAFPYFWLAMLLLYLFGFELGWFPLGHAYGDELEPAFTVAFVADVLRHAALPAATLVAATIGGWALGMRSTMVAVLGADHVTFALARGLSPARVMLGYAARNAILPNLTQLGMALGFVLGGALLTEMVFGYPGQGYLMLQAVRGQDYPLMQGIFLAITLAVLAANAIIDVLQLWLDPTTRSS